VYIHRVWTQRSKEKKGTYGSQPRVRLEVESLGLTQKGMVGVGNDVPLDYAGEVQGEVVGDIREVEGVEPLVLVAVGPPQFHSRTRTSAPMSLSAPKHLEMANVV
jgi:hypothetical protein